MKPSCVPANDKGYVLLTTMFLMVAFLSLASLLFYPLGTEVGKDSGFYITDRNSHRYRQALYGAVADQCGTTLAHCSSLYGDYPSPGRFGKNNSRFHRRLWARIYGTVQSDDGGDITIPQPYLFGADHFWSGYRGKRYLYLLPSDQWNGDTYFDVPNQFSHYHPFYGPYAQMRLNSLCGGSEYGVMYSNDADFAGVKALNLSFAYKAPPKVSVVLKDFSPERNEHQLRLVLIGSLNHRDNMYFDLASGYPDIHPNYRLYEFEQVFSGLYGLRLAHDTGQKKLIIQVQQSSGAPWVTRDTHVLVLSPGEQQTVEQRFQVNFYG